MASPVLASCEDRHRSKLEMYCQRLSERPRLLKHVLVCSASNVPDDNQYKWEACLHDYLYRTKSVKITRREADLVFKEAMEVGVVAGWKEVSLYSAVYCFGGGSFQSRN